MAHPGEQRRRRDGAHNISHRSVRVPDAHYEPPLALPRPVGHDGHHAGPASGLEQAGNDLHKQEKQSVLAKMTEVCRSWQSVDWKKKPATTHQQWKSVDARSYAGHNLHTGTG
eukprot:1156458-Pelagomonas_calceolata.AAC.11